MNDQQHTEEQGQDPLVKELGERLYALEEKYGISADRLKPSGAYGLASQLIQRLHEVEQKVGVDGLPVENGAKVISWEQAQDVRFLRKHNISIEQITRGEVEVR